MKDRTTQLFTESGLGRPTGGQFTDHEAFRQDTDAAIKQVAKTVRRTLFVCVAGYFGCLLVTVVGIVCIVLGCLKLFGVI